MSNRASGWIEDYVEWGWTGISLSLSFTPAELQWAGWDALVPVRRCGVSHAKTSCSGCKTGNLGQDFFFLGGGLILRSFWVSGMLQGGLQKVHR